MRTFVLLGIGAAGRDFRDKLWSLPHGNVISWIRWRDADWGSSSLPTIHGKIENWDDIAPLPPEMTEDWLDHSGDAGRFVFAISDGQPFGTEADAAAAYADAFAGLLSIAAPFGYEPEVIELDPAWAQAREAVIQQVHALDHRPSYGGPHPTLSETWMFGDDLVAQVLGYMDPLLRDGDVLTWGVFPAVVYFRLSVYELSFTPDDRQFLCGTDRDIEPATPYERARVEQSFHNCFKGLEALLNGEPPRDPERLAQRLRQRGIVPDENPIPPDATGLSMAERILAGHRARDKASAHGGSLGRRRARLRYYDLMALQWVVADAIMQVVARDAPVVR